MTTDFDSNPLGTQPPPTVRFMNSELNISPGELFYGLGCAHHARFDVLANPVLRRESFGALVKNGQSVSMWNSDGGLRHSVTV